MNLDNISVAAKLRVLTIAVVLALGTSAGWMQLRSESNEREAIDRIEKAQNNVTRATRWRGLIETNIQRIIATSISADPAVGETFGPVIQKTIAESAATQVELMQAAHQPEDKAAFEHIGAARLRLIDLTKQLHQLQSAGDLAALSGFLKDTMKPAFGVYLEALDGFVELQAAHQTAAKDEARALSRATAWSGAALLLGVASAALFAMTLVSRSICRPLAETVRLSQAIAAGDLTQQIRTDRKDEIGASMSAMAEMNLRLRALVCEVQIGVQSVTVASSEIAAGSLDLSTRTERAASSLQEAASSMEQLASTVSQTADSAELARQLAASAIEASERGGIAFEQVQENMARITGSSRRIGDITATIDGIAFQTNILALNAAVEAARAGEQGRGFAVVAGEVRSLAQRSAAAAREIKSLIGDSEQAIASGAVLVERAGGVLAEVVSGIRSAGNLIGEISAASKEQRQGIAQMNVTVSRLDQITQQNAALVEESAGAATSMQAQAARLQVVVGTFQLT